MPTGALLLSTAALILTKPSRAVWFPTFLHLIFNNFFNIQVIEAIEDRSKLVFFVRGMFLKTNSSNNINVKIKSEYSTKSWHKNICNVLLVPCLALIQRLIYYRQYLRLCACHSHNHMCLYNLDPFNTMSTIPYDIVRRLTRTPALYWCYHCIPGEILSHFYLRQSSESPILTILEAL